MYKKLSATFIFFSIFMIFAFTFSNVCASFSLDGFSAINSVFALNNGMDKSSFLLAVSEDTSSVNTEIVARRVGSGLATAGLGGVGTGIGLVFSGLIKGFSRNPSLKDDLFSYAIFGFALTEAIGLFALMMAFMLLYA